MSELIYFRSNTQAGAGVATPISGGGHGPCPTQEHSRMFGCEKPARDSDLSSNLTATFEVAARRGLRQAQPNRAKQSAFGVIARKASWMALSVVAVCSHGLRALSRWQRERRAAVSLQALDDATLKDIGICRCEIDFVARSQSTWPWQV
jgi:uncharacterized protein YjiS (DUF1127 family)